VQNLDTGFTKMSGKDIQEALLEYAQEVAPIAARLNTLETKLIEKIITLFSSSKDLKFFQLIFIKLNICTSTITLSAALSIKNERNIFIEGFQEKWIKNYMEVAKDQQSRVLLQDSAKRQYYRTRKACILAILSAQMHIFFQFPLNMDKENFSSYINKNERVKQWIEDSNEFENLTFALPLPNEENIQLLNEQHSIIKTHYSNFYSDKDICDYYGKKNTITKYAIIIVYFFIFNIYFITFRVEFGWCYYMKLNLFNLEFEHHPELYSPNNNNKNPDLTKNLAAKTPKNVKEKRDFFSKTSSSSKK
jgi:hypothetical protein